jgi:hypothetical protein
MTTTISNNNNKKLGQFIGIFIISILFIGACHPKDRKMDLSAKNIPEIAKKTQEQFPNATCNNQEFAKKLTDEIKKNGIVIQESIANKEIEYLDCAGKVFSHNYGAEKNVFKFVTIESNLIDPTTKINFISIENERTCVKQNISPASDEYFNTAIENPSEKEEKATKLFKTTVNSQGKLKLLVTDQALNSDANSMKLRDGDNFIVIKYFGNCTKYRNDKDDKLSDAYNCETAELLGTQEVYLELNIKRTETSEKLQHKFCPKSH